MNDEQVRFLLREMIAGVRTFTANHHELRRAKSFQVANESAQLRCVTHGKNWTTRTASWCEDGVNFYAEVTIQAVAPQDTESLFERDRR